MYGGNSDVRATRDFAPGRVYWYILANTIRTMSVTIIIDKHIDSKHSRTYMSFTLNLNYPSFAMSLNIQIRFLIGQL